MRGSIRELTKAVTGQVAADAYRNRVQENLDYVLTWNSVMLQSSVGRCQNGGLHIVDTVTGCDDSTRGGKGEENAQVPGPHQAAGREALVFNQGDSCVFLNCMYVICDLPPTYSTNNTRTKTAMNVDSGV